MASSADELESEDPDDELELDDDPEPPSRVEDCSVVFSPDQRSLIDSTSYHFSARTTLRHQRGGYGEQDRESGTTDNQGGGRLVEPSAIKQPGPELQYANAHISQDREPAVVDRCEPPYFQGGLSALEGVLYTYVPNTNQHFVVGTHVEQGNLIHPTD